MSQAIIPPPLGETCQNLHKSFNTLKSHIDSFYDKLETIYNFLKSLESSFNLPQFGEKLKRLNQSIMDAKVEDECGMFPDEILKEVGELKKIIRLVKKYIVQQEEYLEKYKGEKSFREHISHFMAHVNEEASVLFCYVVKDSFEFMDAPEKKLLVQLNRQFHNLIKPVIFKDDLDKIKNGTPSIITFSATAADLFREIIVLLKRATRIRCIQFLVVAPDSGNIEVKLYSYVDHLPMYDVAHEGGIIADAAKTKKAICVNSVYEDPRYDIFDATIKSELAVPILFGKNVYGVLNFEDNHLNRFTEEFITTIQEICTFTAGKLKAFRDLHSLRRERIV